MFIDWLKTLRDGSGRRSTRRRLVRELGAVTSLERRTLLSATAVGGETRVNTFTTGSQWSSAVATDANGNYVVTWQSIGQDGSGNGIYAQRYNAAGVPQGTEFRVNSYTTHSQQFPAIGMDADGDFVVTWQSNGQDGSNYGIYAQRYNAAGVAQGTEFRVNSYITGNQSSPSIGMDADGDFVVTWQSFNQDGSNDGIYAQRYNAAGVPQGTEFQVNSYTNSFQGSPAIGMDADGDFLITWQSYGQDGSNYGIYAQRYNAAGVPQGTEFQVNSSTNNFQGSPAIGMDADGDFVVTWQSSGQDGSGHGIYAQRYNAAGVPQGTEFRVNSYTNSIQSYPAIGMDADGDFLITWQSYLQDGDGYGNYAQRYDATGVPQGTEFQVNSFTTSWQRFSAIGMDADGDFVVTWHSDGQDGSGYGIYAQRYRSLTVGQETRVNSTTANSQVNSAVATDANGNYVVTWQSYNQDGESWGVYAQRYNAAGVPLGTEFRVNSTTAGYQSSPAIGMDADGDFVVTWQSYGQDGGNWGVYAQRFNAAGVPLGTEFRVNSTTAGVQNLPAIGIDADGDFVVTWQSDGQDGSGYGIYAQRYNAAGVAQGSEFRVNSFTAGTQASTAIGMDADGDFVIAWDSSAQDGSGYGIYAQRYNAAGIPQGTEFRVNSTTSGGQNLPAIGIDADGDFVVTWRSTGQDGDGYGIYAQRYNAFGVAQRTEFRVNSYITSNQSSPSIGMDANGDFVVTWHSSGQDGSGYGIYAQRYTPTGVPQGSEFQVNSYITGNQSSPSIGLDADGDFVVTWQSFNQDGSNDGIYAQRYRSLTAGQETRVNSTTFHHQSTPAVATDADGNYVVSWQSYNQDGESWNVHAQRYNAAGIPLGTEFRVNSFTAGTQASIAIGMDADGDFVIAWDSSAQDGSGYGIYAQRYNAAGIPQGTEFQVNTTTSGGQNLPAIGIDADGDFVVTWQSDGQDGSGNGIYAQRYNAAGIPQGTEFQVNSYITNSQSSPSIGMDADGDFVVTWHSFGQDGSGDGIYAQRYNAAGVPQGTEFRVNSYITGNQSSPSIGLDAAGDFVVTWQSTGQDGSGIGIYAQRYNAAGVPQGTVFRVNSYITGNQSFPSIGLDADGDFVVTWHSVDQDGSGNGIYAQRYNAAGVAQGTEFRVNSWITDYQQSPAVGMDADGDFVVTWQSAVQDGSGNGIYSQRYRVNNAAPVLNAAGAPTLNPITQNLPAANNTGTLVAEMIARMAPSGGISDIDFDALQGIAINGISNTYGSWEYSINGGTNWTPIAVTGNTNALLLAADANTRVRFLPNANVIGSSLFAFVAWDRTTGINGGTANVTQRGGTTPFSLAYETASISINNAAPVLNNSGTPTLDSIPQNVYGINNTGTLVSDLIARMAPNGITDPNPGALQGIAINGLGNTATGDWQYSTNGGTTWSLIGTTGNSNARLLAADANTRIRYVPQVGYQGTATFSFVAWDRTTGSNGTVTSVGTRGGTTPYSTDFDYASISIVNAAPVLNNAGNPLFDGILPNVPDANNPGTLVSTLISRMSSAGGITDANPYALRGIAVIGKSGAGIWEFSTNNGSSWAALNSTSAANATLLTSDTNTRIRYRPALNAVGEAKIAFVAWDQTSGSNGAVVNASTRGNATAFSNDYEYASIFTNTAPTLNNSGTPSLDAIPNTISNAANVGTLVSTILSRMAANGITDPDPGALRGMAIIAVTGTATGTWQYTTNNGVNWSNILTTGSVNALLLSNNANTKIRYVPNPGFVGTALIAFAAWDQTQGVNGATVNAGARGGATPFSLDHETASILITN